MFTSYPVYNPYRALRLISPQLHGEDVFALQWALLKLGFKLPQFGADGYFGKETDVAVRAAQKQFSIAGGIDGIAGSHTQEALAVKFVNSSSLSSGVSPKRLYGTCAHESGFHLGNYSVKHFKSDGTWTFDIGVAQRNSLVLTNLGLTWKDGFKADESIAALAVHTRHFYDLFEGVEENRRWDLAQGAWNAPAFACYYAKREGATKVTTAQTAVPSSDAALKFDAYVASVSAYAYA